MIGLLDTKGRNKDVDYNDDEDECCGDVLHNVQLVVGALIVQVPLHNEDEQDAHGDLQDEGYGDEGDEGGVEGEVWTLLQDGLQLGGVGHE